MNKLKVMTIVGTRPEIIRLSRVICKLDVYCNHILVHTGQNYDYELNEIFFKELNIRKPDYFLNAAMSSSVKTIGKILVEIDDVLNSVKPDAILVLGDTNSCISVVAAKKKKIPIFHMEAGNRCYDQRVPEEINRKIVDHVSDINLTYSDISREYLLNEGLNPKYIIKTGSPMFEVLSYFKTSIYNSNILNSLKLKESNYFLFSIHREENIDSEQNFTKFINILNKVADHYQLPIIVSTHPRTRKKIDSKNIKMNKLINLSKPLGFFDYNFLQINATVVLSDSGTISEESSILNFPALNMREAHERPEGMEEAAVMLVGMEINRIIQCIEILSDQNRGNKRLLRRVEDYSMPNVSDKVLRLIHSYTDYINKDVWKKS